VFDWGGVNGFVLLEGSAVVVRKTGDAIAGFIAF